MKNVHNSGHLNIGGGGDMFNPGNIMGGHHQGQHQGQHQGHHQGQQQRHGFPPQLSCQFVTIQVIQIFVYLYLHFIYYTSLPFIYRVFQNCSKRHLKKSYS